MYIIYSSTAYFVHIIFVCIYIYILIYNLNVCDRKGKSALEILEARLSAVSTLDDVDFSSDDDGSGNDDDNDQDDDGGGGNDNDVPVDANENNYESKLTIAAVLSCL